MEAYLRWSQGRAQRRGNRIKNESNSVDFIRSFLSYTKYYESPTSFWKWAAYAVIAASLKDNCYKQEKDNKLCTNIYVLLMADSAVQRKDRPVRLATKLITKLNRTKIINGRASIQAIIDELARAGTDKNGKMIGGGSALFSVPELAAGLVSDPSAVSLLTEMYSYQESFTDNLRGHGKFEIKNLCLTMLAASNKELLINIYDNQAIHGGLLGRTFLVFPDEFRAGNSLWEDFEDPEKFEEMRKMIESISTLKGVFRFDPDAQAEYDAWYLPFRKSYEKKADRSGIAGRIHTGIIKLAMILGVNDLHDVVVCKKHIEEAISECLQLMPNYGQLTMSSGKSSLAEVGSIALNEIWDSPGHCISRKRLLSRNWNNFDAETLDKLVTTLHQAGMIEMGIESEEIAYKMTQKCIETLFKEKR